MNDDIPLTLHAFPRALVHIDGDAFFASCEQARDPQLQGRPVVTGKERGIAASMSYEAKACGVTRGMRLARSTRDLLNTLADTTTPHGRLLLTVLGGLAEFERELIKARTSEGRTRAKARGASAPGAGRAG